MSRWLAAFGTGLAWLVGDVLRVRRAHAELAIERAGIEAPSRVASTMYRQLARGLCELLALAFEPKRLASSQVELGPAFDRIPRGRGAVIATAHTGNWDLVACAVAEQRPLTVITKRLSVRVLDRLWQGLRRRHGVELVTVGEAARAGAVALRNRQWVAALIDQAPERNRSVTTTTFLGRAAQIDLAPALLALRARVPLVVAFPRRLSGDRHTVDVELILEPPLTGRRQWAEQAMVRATRALERHVRAQPEQWLWMHRRWKGTAPGRLPARQGRGNPARWPKTIRSRSAS